MTPRDHSHVTCLRRIPAGPRPVPYCIVRRAITCLPSLSFSDRPLRHVRATPRAFGSAGAFTRGAAGAADHPGSPIRSPTVSSLCPGRLRSQVRNIHRRTVKQSVLWLADVQTSSSAARQVKYGVICLRSARPAMLAFRRAQCPAPCQRLTGCLGDGYCAALSAADVPPTAPTHRSPLSLLTQRRSAEGGNSAGRGPADLPITASSRWTLSVVIPKAIRMVQVLVPYLYSRSTSFTTHCKLFVSLKAAVLENVASILSFL